MSVSFSNSNGAFTITDSVSGILYSGNNTLHFQKINNKIAIYGFGDGWNIQLPLYSLSDITTIGGVAVSGTLDGAINQLSALLIDVLSVGAATSALQEVGNTTLTNIENKLPEPTALNSQTTINADAINVRPYEFPLLVVQNRIQGHSWVLKAGKKAAINQGQNLTEDIWGSTGAYTGFVASVEQAEISSTSPSDTGTVTILVLESATSTSYTSVQVTLQGTTWVTLPVNVYRGHTMSYNNGTATGFNAGVITLRQKVTTTNLFLVMAAGTSQTYNAGYTIPFNCTGYVYEYECSLQDGATGTIEGALWIRLNGQSPRLRRNFVTAQGANYQVDLFGAFVLPALTDIQMRITNCSANNTVVLGGYTILLIQNP